MPLWVQIPESLPTKVCPPIYLWLIKLNPCIPVSSLKLRRKTVSVSAIPVIVLESLLMSPEIWAHAGMEWLNGREDVDLRKAQVFSP